MMCDSHTDTHTHTLEKADGKERKGSNVFLFKISGNVGKFLAGCQERWAKKLS
jgi:hypothetical protein